MKRASRNTTARFKRRWVEVMWAYCATTGAMQRASRNTTASFQRRYGEVHTCTCMSNDYITVYTNARQRVQHTHPTRKSLDPRERNIDTTRLSRIALHPRPLLCRDLGFIAMPFSFMVSILFCIVGVRPLRPILSEVGMLWVVGLHA